MGSGPERRRSPRRLAAQRSRAGPAPRARQIGSVQATRGWVTALAWARLLAGAPRAPAGAAGPAAAAAAAAAGAPRDCGADVLALAVGGADGGVRLLGAPAAALAGATPRLWREGAPPAACPERSGRPLASARPGSRPGARAARRARRAARRACRGAAAAHTLLHRVLRPGPRPQELCMSRLLALSCDTHIPVRQ